MFQVTEFQSDATGCFIIKKHNSKIKANEYLLGFILPGKNHQLFPRNTFPTQVHLHIAILVSESFPHL